MVLSGVAGHQLKVLVALVPYLVITVGIYPLWGVCVWRQPARTGAGGLSLSLSTGLCDSAPSLCRVPRSGLRLSTVCAGAVETPNTRDPREKQKARRCGCTKPCAKRGTLRGSNKNQSSVGGHPVRMRVRRWACKICSASAMRRLTKRTASLHKHLSSPPLVNMWFALRVQRPSPRQMHSARRQKLPH